MSLKKKFWHKKWDEPKPRLSGLGFKGMVVGTDNLVMVFFHDIKISKLIEQKNVYSRMKFKSFSFFSPQKHSCEWESDKKTYQIFNSFLSLNR